MKSKIRFENEKDFEFLVKMLKKTNDKEKKDLLNERLNAYTHTEVYNENEITIYLFEKLPEYWEDLLSDIHYFGEETESYYLDINKTKKKYFEKVFIETIPIKEYESERFSEEYGLLTAQIEIKNKNYDFFGNILSGVNYPATLEDNKEYQILKYTSKLI